MDIWELMGEIEIREKHKKSHDNKSNQTATMQTNTPGNIQRNTQSNNSLRTYNKPKIKQIVRNGVEAKETDAEYDSELSKYELQKVEEMVTSQDQTIQDHIHQ